MAGRTIPFVADPAVDAEFGTGLVKVTPAHDPSTSRSAVVTAWRGIQVIDRHGRMTAAAGEDFAGLDRDEARQSGARATARERAPGRARRSYDHNVGHSQRSGEPIEPLVSTQWFCDVSGMARQALGALDDGSLELVPESWGKTWEHWLENIRPWCISRQLWWGHQIPAWYDESGTLLRGAQPREEAARAGRHRPR